MVDEPHGNSDKQDSYDERDDPEVPTRDIPEDAEAHDAQEDHHRGQRKIAAVYEWAIDAAFPWIRKRIITIITSSNFWTAAATVVIAIATIVYTLYARKQWSAMNDTLNEIKKQTPSIQVQATSAQNSVTEAQRQTRIDERPWIKFKLRDWDTTSNPPKSAELTLTLNQPFVVPVQFVNIGKTTALNVQGGVIIKLVEMGQEPSMPTAQEAVVMKGEPMPKGHSTPRPRIIFPFESGTIYPGDFASVDAHRFRQTGKYTMADDLVTQEDISGFVRRKKYFVAWGEVHYSDIFGTHHWTRFCVAYPFASEKCALFNDVDKNDGTDNANPKPN